MANKWFDEMWNTIFPARKANQIAEQNLQFQRDKLQYDKDLQQTIFDREDTASQRKVDDLRQAGLSPLLAAGQPAKAGGVVPTKAPERTLQDVQMRTANIHNALGTIATVGKTFAEIDLMGAQSGNLQTGTEGKQLDNEIVRQTMDAEIARLKDQSQITNDDLKRSQLALKEANMHESWRQQLQTAVTNYGKTRAKKLGVEQNWGDFLNPRVVEYFTGLAVMNIKERDDKLYERLKTPYGGQGYSLTKMLMPYFADIIGPLLDQIANGAGVLLRSRGR